MRGRILRTRRCLLGLLVGAFALSGAASASAAPTTTPWLKPFLGMVPATITPGGKAEVLVSEYNLGDANLEPAAGHPVKAVTTLPAGWTVESANIRIWPNQSENIKPPEPCEVAGDVVTCDKDEVLGPFEWWEARITVKAPPTAATGEYPASVHVEGVEGLGGETPAVERSLKVSNEPPPFGVEQYDFTPEGETGGSATQAGGHPFQLTTYLHLNTVPHTYILGNTHEEREGETDAGSLLKDAHVDLPPGLVGDTRAVPKCRTILFDERTNNGDTNLCPKESVIGAADVQIEEPVNFGFFSKPVPVFNLEPDRGEPARFGFSILGVPVVFDTSVNGGDFHVTVNVDEAPQANPIISTLVTIWGSPGDTRHDSSRGTDCIARGNDREQGETCEELGPHERRATEPFLDMPTQCHEALLSQVTALPWSPAAGTSKAQSSPFQATGCPAVPFEPALEIKPTETRASTPTGLKVILKSPQQTTLEEGKIGEADIRDTKVVFPEGMQLSPSAANGLQACTEGEVGFTGKHPGTETAEFKPEIANVETPQEEQTREEAGTLCPAASKVGTVKIKTPLIEHPLEGSVFLAKQEENPYGSLFGVYMVVKDPISGVVVKLAGKVSADPETGQVTSEFNDAPQAPFEELELNLFEGSRASFATPAKCGNNFTTQATLLPWSETGAPELPEGPLTFSISSGPGGTPAQPTPCPSGSLPFGIGFSASAEQHQAGAFTPFTVVLTRADGQQQPTNLTMTLPPGIAGMLSSVKQCPEPQASQGTCGPESLIGSASAVVGLGKTPFTETGGRVYITGPYQGAPFGLSVVLPAEAGPFKFGYVVTRSKILVNQTTAQLTISSELPTMVNTLGFPGSACSSPCKTGVPVQLRQVVVKVERPGNAPFEFNPTNCSPMKITGSIRGNEGAVQNIEQPYQVSGCQNLPFKPEFTVETGANYSRTEGTFLKVTVKAKPGEANIAKTKLIFPLQLPSRNTTLQQACLAATFEKNPALCPPAAAIGTAIARTPVLNSPLIGPAYLVSHGGEAFPDVVFVLQGEGITLLLDGKTNIHNGITSSTFEAVPDAPVSSFEVNLPKKQFSAFTGYENLCEPMQTETKKVTTTVTVGKGKHRKKKKVVKTEEVKTPVPGHALLAPATLTGQNGDVINEEIKVKVAECKSVQGFKQAKPKAKKKKKGKKASHKARKKH